MPMTRDDATKIARRIMDRIEQERTIHLDSMVDEIVAGMALVTPRHTISEKDVPRSDHSWWFGVDPATGGDKTVMVTKGVDGKIRGYSADMLIADDVELAEPNIGMSYTSTLLPAGSVIASVGIGEDGSLVCYDAFGKKIGD